MADETPAKQEEHQSKEGFGSVLAEFVGSHKVLLIGAAIGTAFVLFIVSKSQSNASNAGTASQAANQQGSLAGNQTSGTAFALDAMQTQLNNLAATVSQIGNTPGPAGPQGPIGKTGPAGGTTSNPPPNIPLWQQLHGNLPIIPSGQYKGPSFSNLKPGTKYTFGGVTYTLTTSVKGMPGSGVLYGINPQGKVTTLYGPPSAYHNVLNPLANHSPMLSSLALNQNSSGGDLSHPGPGGGSTMQWNPVARTGHSWSGGR